MPTPVPCTDREYWTLSWQIWTSLRRYPPIVSKPKRKKKKFKKRYTHTPLPLFFTHALPARSQHPHNNKGTPPQLAKDRQIEQLKQSSLILEKQRHAAVKKSQSLEKRMQEMKTEMKEKEHENEKLKKDLKKFRESATKKKAIPPPFHCIPCGKRHPIDDLFQSSTCGCQTCRRVASQKVMKGVRNHEVPLHCWICTSSEVPFFFAFASHASFFISI